MKNFALLVLLCSGLSACAMPRTVRLPTETPTPTFTPTSTPTATLTPTPLPTVTPTPLDGDTGWRLVRDGLEVRDIDIIVGKRQIDHLFLLRIDPAGFRFEVAYDEHPHSLDDWQKRSGALVVFNGGYFQIAGQRYLPAGLLIVNEQAFGKTYRGYGGMFSVGANGPDLRSLEQQPYEPGELFEYALQAFPLLVRPGGVLGFPAQREDNVLARRTVIGRDRAGRFIVLVTASSYFTLHRMSAYLVDSDLDLDIALNLDGGSSTGLVLAEPYTSIPAFSLLPIVITVYPR